jgi:hypothetical protein
MTTEVSAIAVSSGAVSTLSASTEILPLSAGPGALRRPPGRSAVEASLPDSRLACASEQSEGQGAASLTGMPTEPTWTSLEEDLEPGEWAVLAAFGRVMLSAQLLEITIFQLAHLDRNTPNGVERAVRRIDGLLKQPKTDQARRVRELEPQLLEELELALGVRNKLAHEGLVRYQLDAAVRGERARDEAVAMFRAIRLFMESVRASLDRLADERLEERGVPDLDDSEMEELMASLRRWAASGPSALELDW